MNDDNSSLDISFEKINLSDMKSLTDLRHLRLVHQKQEPIPLTDIMKNEVVYCSTAISDFRTHLRNFGMLKKGAEVLKVEVLPKMSMKLPIDEFEFMEESDIAW